MKIKISHYLLKLVRENLLYFISFSILIFISVVSVIIFISKFSQMDKQIIDLENNNLQLKKKAELVLYKEKIINEGYNIIEINELFSQLVPNQEDYFSIMLALERISLQTNFMITSYQINLASTTQNKLSITIEGEGDRNSFMDFLQNYQFSGGRLITIDKIDFNTTGITKIKLSLNFYNGEVKASQSSVESIRLTDADRRLIDLIKRKTQLYLVTEEEVNTDYPTKTNPF